MAGELEHIRPSNPSDGWYVAARTRNINWVDANGVSRSISHVYWSPTNNVNDRKLIWQRDHSPSVRYESLNNDKRILFKWVCPNGVNSISSADTWVTQTDSISYQFSVGELRNNNTELWIIGCANGNAATWNRVIDDTFVINSQGVYSRKVSVSNLNNIVVTPGNTYWIFVTDSMDQTPFSKCIIDTLSDSEYIEYNDQMWMLNSISTTYNRPTNFQIKTGVHKIKASINGVEV